MYDFFNPLKKKKMQLESFSADKNKGLIMHHTSRLVKVKPHSFHSVTRSIGIPGPWENGVFN